MSDVQKFLKDLLEQGDKQGFIVIDDITSVYDEDSEECELIMKKLEAKGIDVVPAADMVTLEIDANDDKLVLDDVEDDLLLEDDLDVDFDIDELSDEDFQNDIDLEITNITA